MKAILHVLRRTYVEWECGTGNSGVEDIPMTEGGNDVNDSV